MENLLVRYACTPAAKARRNVLVVVRSEGDQSCVGEFGPDRDGGLNAGHQRHAEIEQSDVGQMFPIALNCLAAVTGGDDKHVLLPVNDRAHTHSGHQVVLGHQNTNFRTH